MSEAAAIANLPRVLFLDHVGALGGAELCLIDVAHHAAARAEVILMADGPLRKSLEAGGVKVSVLAAPANITSVRRSSGFGQSLKSIPHVFWMARQISKTAKRFDVVWANSQKSFVIGSFAAALARRPLVWHMHDILTADHFSATNRKIAVGLANRFATRVVTVSNAGRQSFLDSGGKPELVRVLYNGIDPESFNAPRGPAVLRQEFGIGDVPLVGVFGRLTAWKGQHILIRAIAQLPGVHALCVGEALFNEDEYGRSLRALATELGVSDRVHFAGFRSDIPAAMSEVDVVVHTSTSPEPFGRVIVEAMLARRPVIASASGGAAEIVTNGHDGVQITPGDPAILAAAIRAILDHPESTQAMVEQGYKTAITKFSLSAYLSGFDAIAVEAASQWHGTPTATRQGVES